MFIMFISKLQKWMQATKMQRILMPIPKLQKRIQETKKDKKERCTPPKLLKNLHKRIGQSSKGSKILTFNHKPYVLACKIDKSCIQHTVERKLSSV